MTDTKKCYKCKTKKPLNLFSTDNSRKDKKNPRCNDCLRTHRVNKAFGITLKEYESYFEKANKTCYSCGSTKNLVLDHNHETGEIRGVLCNSCNRALGYAKDNINILSKLIEYLKENGSYAS